MFERLQQEQLVGPEVMGLDSTSVKAHPDGHGAPTTQGPQTIGKSRGGWTTKIHMLAVSARTAVDFCLSPEKDHDGPWERELLRRQGPIQLRLPLVADRAYEGNETRQLALALGYEAVIPPKPTSACHGPTTGTHTSEETKPSGSSTGSKATDASTPDTTNSTSSS